MELKFQTITAKQREQATFSALFLNFSASQGSTAGEQLNYMLVPQAPLSGVVPAPKLSLTASCIVLCISSCLLDHVLSSPYVSRTMPYKLKLKNFPNIEKSPQDTREKGNMNLRISILPIHDLSTFGHIYCPCSPFPHHFSPHFLTPFPFCVLMEILVFWVRILDGLPLRETTFWTHCQRLCWCPSC